MLKIVVDRLKEHCLAIDEKLDPVFMDINEDELKFSFPIEIHGFASITADYFVLKLNIKTFVLMPCTICNKLTKVKIIVHDFTYTEDLANVKGPSIDCSIPLREGILLELPLFAECDDMCKERKNINHYLSKESTISQKMNFPFADLHLK